MLKRIIILLILVWGAAGCASNNSEGIEKTVGDQYSQDMANQANENWKIEQDADLMEKASAKAAADQAEQDTLELDAQAAYKAEGLAASGVCRLGCEQHVENCDIKGNISFDTKEKVYHTFSGEFYWQTTIEPQYGERWFCTEEQAIANGWRKSYK